MDAHSRPACLNSARPPLRPFSRPARRAQSTACRAAPAPPGRPLSRLARWAAQLQAWQLCQWQQAAARVTCLGLAAALALGPGTPAQAVTTEQLLFLEAWRAVDRAYYDKQFNGKPWFKIREQYLKQQSFNSREETYAAIRSLVAQLDDPFTRFLEPARYAALKRGTAGSVTGVGLEVGFATEAGSAASPVVIAPSPGGPADRAGIQPGDALLAVDGRATAGSSLYDTGELLQGAEGSEVTLTIQPAGGGGPREVALARERLTLNPVSSQLCARVPRQPAGNGSAGPAAEDAVGYIRVATFSKQTAEGFRLALKQLQSEGASRYVLDIRNNGGGLFPAGVSLARMLLEGGDIVLIADSQGVRDSYSADGGALEPAAPLAVLVNRGTASASEVLAGALKDNGRGRIVGEPTFGKGLIQTIVELSDGSGVAVTVARYQTPDGEDINKRGITPDVPLSAGEMPAANGSGFCEYLGSRGSTALFGAAVQVKQDVAGRS